MGSDSDSPSPSLSHSSLPSSSSQPTSSNITSGRRRRRRLNHRVDSDEIRGEEEDTGEFVGGSAARQAQAASSGPGVSVSGSDGPAASVSTLLVTRLQAWDSLVVSLDMWALGVDPSAGLGAPLQRGVPSFACAAAGVLNGSALQQHTWVFPRGLGNTLGLEVGALPPSYSPFSAPIRGLCATPTGVVVVKFIGIPTAAANASAPPRHEVLLPFPPTATTATLPSDTLLPGFLYTMEVVALDVRLSWVVDGGGEQGLAARGYYDYPTGWVSDTLGGVGVPALSGVLTAPFIYVHSPPPPPALSTSPTSGSDFTTPFTMILGGDSGVSAGGSVTTTAIPDTPTFRTPDVVPSVFAIAAHLLMQAPMPIPVLAALVGGGVGPPASPSALLSSTCPLGMDTPSNALPEWALGMAFLAAAAAATPSSTTTLLLLPSQVCTSLALLPLTRLASGRYPDLTLPPPPPPP